jgi:hypothetical protein
MQYFIIAVSKNHAQLFQVTSEGITPLAVEGMPANMSEAWAGMERHEQSIQSHSSGGGTSMLHGQGGAKDVEEQEEDEYLRKIAKGVHSVVHTARLPLVFAGTVEEYGMFKKFDQSDMLLEDYIKGSAQQMPMEELKQKADEIVKSYQMKQAEALIEEYGNLLGTGRTSNDIDAIIASGELGKIDLLLVTDGAEKEDSKIQDAMAHTVAHRGRVALVEAGKLPEGAVVAAILRL